MFLYHTRTEPLSSVSPHMQLNQCERPKAASHDSLGLLGVIKCHFERYAGRDASWSVFKLQWLAGVNGVTGRADESCND